MKSNLLGYVQAPNYSSKKSVKAQVKKYTPYVYKAVGVYLIVSGLLSTDPI